MRIKIKIILANFIMADSSQEVDPNPKLGYAKSPVLLFALSLHQVIIALPHKARINYQRFDLSFFYLLFLFLFVLYLISNLLF
jgi:hypothetical protein